MALSFSADRVSRGDLVDFGFRAGARGTHTSRTMMLAELNAALEACPPGAERSDYASAIIEHNCLGKPTAATRRLSNQRLGELYGLDATIPLFRVLRKIWEAESAGRPLMAMACALARDPLLAATAPAILAMSPGDELSRETVKSGVRALVGQRLNEATLEKVVRNTASSWTQSGHLEGRTFKKRKAVQPTPGSVTLSLYMAFQCGFRGEQLFSNAWVVLLDCSVSLARELALEAKRRGLLDLRIAGDVVDINFTRLDPAAQEG